MTIQLIAYGEAASLPENLSWTQEVQADAQGYKRSVYNSMPASMRDITDLDFWSFMGHRGLVAMEHRQVFHKNNGDVIYVRSDDVAGSYWDTTLFYLADGSALGRAIIHRTVYAKDGVKLPFPLREIVVKYLAFGCEHDYESLSWQECKDQGIFHGGSCWSVRRCKLCGDIQSHDTSD